jgi:hypothetical protein
MLVRSYNQRYSKIKNGLIYGDNSILNLHLMIRVVLLKGGGTGGEALLSSYHTCLLFLTLAPMVMATIVVVFMIMWSTHSWVDLH